MSRSREIETLIIFRVHRRPAADFVPDKPQVRRDAPDVANLSRVVRRALGETAFRPKDRGERLIEVSVGDRWVALRKGLEVFEEVTRHAVHRQAEESNDTELSYVNEGPIFDGFCVCVDADGFAEEVVVFL